MEVAGLLKLLYTFNITGNYLYNNLIKHIMDYISITYVLIWRLKTDKHIRLTKDLKMCFNKKSGKEIITSNNMRKGFWVGRKFYRLDRLKSFIELIPKFESKESNWLNEF